MYPKDIDDFLNTQNIDNSQQRFQALHHQFVASARVIKYAKSLHKNLQMGCMIAYRMIYIRCLLIQRIFVLHKR